MLFLHFLRFGNKEFPYFYAKTPLKKSEVYDTIIIVRSRKGVSPAFGLTPFLRLSGG